MNVAIAIPSSSTQTVAPLEVLSLTPGDFTRWDAFVQSAPQATFFHRAGWKTVIERTFGHSTHFFLAQANGNIEGILPLAQVKSRLFGHSLVSLPFCVYGGIAANTERARVALDTTAQKLAQQLAVGHLEYRNVTPFHADWAGSEIYATFRKPIDPDVEQNLLAIPRKQRAMIRKGIKFGLTAEIDANVGRFFALYADNAHRHGTPALPKRYFALLKEVFKDDCELLIISKDRDAVSGVLTFYFRDEVMPYYAGDLPAARDLAANDFKYWELLRRSCEHGYKVFDYGRSKRGTGSFDFKMNWGFEPKPLAYEYQLVKALRVPENSPLNPKYRLMIETWRRMPIELANWLGPHIVKYLG